MSNIYLKNVLHLVIPKIFRAQWGTAKNNFVFHSNINSPILFRKRW